MIGNGNDTLFLHDTWVVGLRRGVCGVKGTL